MFASRTQVDDCEVANQLCISILRDVEENWSSIEESISFEHRPALFDTHPDSARACFFLALFSLELQAIPNLYPPEMTESLRAWTLEHLRRLHGGKLMLEEVLTYEAELGRIEPSDANPAGGIASHLAYRWHGVPADIVEPFVTMELSALLLGFSGRLKRLKQAVEVRRTAPPSNWDSRSRTLRATEDAGVEVVSGAEDAIDRLAKEFLGDE